MPTDLDACQSLIEQQARALDQLLAGSTDYESLRADVWKQSHPEAVRTYRSDERRDTADRNRLTRAQRRLANAKKLEAARLAAKTTEAEQQKSRFIDKLSARRKFLSGQGFTGIGHLRSGGRCTRQLTGGVEVVVIVERIQRIRCRASHGPPNCRRFSTRTPPALTSTQRGSATAMSSSNSNRFCVLSGCVLQCAAVDGVDRRDSSAACFTPSRPASSSLPSHATTRCLGPVAVR